MPRPAYGGSRPPGSGQPQSPSQKSVTDGRMEEQSPGFRSRAQGCNSQGPLPQQEEVQAEDQLKGLPANPMPQGLEETLTALRAQEAFFRALCEHAVMWESKWEKMLKMQEEGIAQAVVAAVRDMGPSLPKTDTFKQAPTIQPAKRRSQNSSSDPYANVESHKNVLASRQSGSEMNLEEVEGYPENQGELALQVEQILGSKAAEFVVATLIVTNAASIGAQVDWSVKNIGQHEPNLFKYLEIFFAIAFMVELALRIYVEGSFFFKSRNDMRGWNIFDSCLVGVSCMELILIAMESIFSLSLRVVRITRLARLARLVRVMQFGRDLRIMVKGITSSILPLFWSMVVLVIVNYLFATCLLQLIIDRYHTDGSVVAALDPELERHFASLPRAMYTMWMCICGGVDWGNVADPLLAENIILAVIFSTYIALALLCVLNIITGVFVETANKNAKLDKELHFLQELAAQRQWMKEARALFRATDKNESGNISLEELQSAVQNPRLRSHFNRIGLDVSPESVKNLFRLIDSDGNGTIDHEEFFGGIIEIQGDARRMDIVRLSHETHALRADLTKFVEYLKSALQSKV